MAEGVSRTTDLYAVLGVDSNASAEEVRVAYRALAQRFHPDHNPDNMTAARRMQEINEAFTVLNVPERRRRYDRLRAVTPAPRQDGGIDPRGAGRGPRPYFRGKNWGMHEGADAPPEHIVRVDPAGFNLVVTSAGDTPGRDVTIYSEAPFAVRIRVICSPWLEPSIDALTLDGGGRARLTISIRAEASRDLRGWRDGGASLVTDDARVFCPDVRVTAIFLKKGQVVARRPAEAEAEHLPHPTGTDLREVDAPAGERRGWRRLFGG